jgi:hypothetical protein
LIVALAASVISVQNGVRRLLIGRARGHLRTQLGQFGLELLIDENKCGNGPTGIAMAGGDEIVGFRV